MTQPVPSPLDDDREPDGLPLSEQLGAERAGTAYWRAVAHDRRVEAARVQRRPLVRAAIAVDRRTRDLQDSAAARFRTLRRTGRGAWVRAAGLPHRRSRPERRTQLAAQVAGLADDARALPDARSVLLVHLGPPPEVRSHRPVEQVGVIGLATDDRSPAAVVAEVDAVVAQSAADLVCLLGPMSEPCGGRWLDLLAAPLHGSTVATAPLLLHPDRPWRSGTAHDLSVRSAGLDVVRGADGTPLLRSRQTGQAPDLGAEPADTIGATGAGLLVDRRAWAAAGGLGPADDLDAAVLDLCLRLRVGGGRTRVVPAAVVTDHRPVGSVVDLVAPLADDGPAWRQVVEAHGPTLARSTASGPTPPAATIALTTATPSRKVAERSGDWHYAGFFARALERAGHEVRLQSIEEADSLAGRACDVHIVLRGLEPVRRTSGQRHVLWVISHPEALEVAECDEADLVVVASRRFADHLRSRTSTPVEVLLQATDPDHFRPRPPDPAHRHPLTVVASTRGVLRRSVADAIAAGLRPAVYGTGWTDRLDPTLVAADHVRMDRLPTVYSSADAVLNDHWETMRRWGFLSNRIFDVLACGTPVISDHLPEVAEVFGDLVATWQGPEDLATTVATLTEDREGWADRTAAARQVVLDGHTFDHRVTELDDLLDRHGPSCARLGE